MKLLKFEYDGYDCYLPKDISLDDPNWVAIDEDYGNYMVYDKNGTDVVSAGSLENAIKIASEYYFDKHKKE